MLERDKFYWLATSVVLTAVSVRPSLMAVEDVSVPELISQLGHDNYVVRQAATEKLDAIGKPALDGLNQALSSGDLEIRWRAAAVRQSINNRLFIGRFEGDWETPKGEWLKITDGRWSSGTPQYGPFRGVVRHVKLSGTTSHVDLVVEVGPTAGQTVRTILKVDGDSLHYCGTYGAERPQLFQGGEGRVVYIFQRSTKEE